MYSVKLSNLFKSETRFMTIFYVGSASRSDYMGHAIPNRNQCIDDYIQ